MKIGGKAVKYTSYKPVDYKIEFPQILKNTHKILSFLESLHSITSHSIVSDASDIRREPFSCLDPT
jgi:hypothetical protein